MSGEEPKINFTYWKNQEPPKSGQLYTDPFFPPNANSLLGKDSNGKVIDSKAYNEKSRIINTNQIGFARASTIFGDKYKLFSETIEMGDVIQGQLGDCYFLSSVANLCKFPSLILRMFKTKETNKDGFYEIILYIDGKPQIVIVDDYLPINKSTKKPVYAQSKGNEIWVMLLEKAWAKVNGGYANIISGLPCEALEFLLGLGSLSYDTENMDTDDFNEMKYEIVKNVQIADQNNCLITCSTSSSKNYESVGLVEGHAYTLISFTQITTSQGKKVYLFRIRNPWSEGEWKGDWSDKSKFWDEKTKSQVNFKDKEDGIFFMNDTDFFKYFTHVEICYILYDSISATYTIEGEGNLQNGSVFNIETEGDGFLSVSVSRKSWRANRELRDKILPTYISVVKYNKKPSSRLKTFSDYIGTHESFQMCALNVKVTKGNYLIYVYRDAEHAQFKPDNKMDIKITCSAKFKHAQMTYDYRNKGFPLLQNIILQAEFQENNYNPDLGEDFDVSSNQLRGDGIGHIIFYISTPGYYLDFTGSTANVKNYIMLSPYLDNGTFHRAIPSGKYLVFLGLMNGVYSSYCFNCFSQAYTTNRRLTAEFDNNDIDLTLYTDINNDIKNENVKERKTQSLENAQKEFYFDIGDGKVQYKSLTELQKTYGDYIKLLDQLTVTNQNSNLRWGIVKGEYLTYVGQFNGEKKEGKGLFITPNNVFAGVFVNEQQNGVGYTYNKDLQLLYYCTYVNGVRKGKPISPEEEKRLKEEEEERKRQEEEKKKEEELKKEQERLRKLEEEKQELLRQQEEEKRRLEEQLKEELRKAEEAKRLEEERIAEEKRKAEEEAKRKEEERQKELQRQKEELERLEKQKLEEAAKRAEELKKQEEERLKKELEEAEKQRKLEEERIKKELEELEKQKEEEEAKKKMEELKKQEEELKQKAIQEAEEAERKKKEAEEEAKKKEEELKKIAEKLIEDARKEVERREEEAKKKAEEAKKEAERLEEEARKKAEEARLEAERKAEEARKKAEEAENKINEIKEQVKQTKDDADKVANDYNEFLEKQRIEMEERRKRREQIEKKMKEEREKKGEEEPTGLDHLFNFFNPDFHRSKKRRNKFNIPFEQDITDMCVTCGCNIF